MTIKDIIIIKEHKRLKEEQTLAADTLYTLVKRIIIVENFHLVAVFKKSGETEISNIYSQRPGKCCIFPHHKHQSKTLVL